MKKLLAAGFIINLMLCLTTQANMNWTVSMEPAKRFIENKSQFDGRNQLPGSAILYGIDWGPAQIYFTANGLTYRFDVREKTDEQEEGRHEAEKFREGSYGKEDKEAKVKTDIVHMEWLNANPSVRLVGLEKADDYFSYTVGGKDNYRNINHIAGYRKLLYENLYPGIDVEYAFHPRGGIKYKLIVHPGADVSVIKMRYTDTGKIILDEEGNIHIGTEYGDIIDHAPVTFYSGEERPIPSVFSLSESTVIFRLGAYEPGKTVIIDPWTVAPPNLPNVNKAYYVKADTSGNAYVFGGDTPYRLQKYDSAGALLWTYFPGWSQPDGWFGALTVDPAGNCYITGGTRTFISKINSSGTLVWNTSSNVSALTEFWAPAFNYDYTQLVVGGTYTVNIASFDFNGAAYRVNLNTGAVDSTVIVSTTLAGAAPNPPFVPNEIRAMCSSPNGNYYFLTLDTIGSLSPSLDINYREPSSYLFSYYLPYGQDGGQGNNGIKATAYLIYTTDGQTLHKRDINNGNILKTVTIPNGSKETDSGIDIDFIDSCRGTGGNVYVGAVGKLHKYDSDLNLIASANVPGEVYDVSVTKNGEVLACGHGFVASVNMNASAPIPPGIVTPLSVTMKQTNLSCHAGVCTGTATATPLSGSPPYTYRWSNGDTTQTVTGLCTGPYIVTVADALCRKSVNAVIISEPQELKVSVASFLSGCDVVAVATPSGGTPPFAYRWSNNDTVASTSGLTPGTYTVTVTDAGNCSATGSVNVTQTGAFSLNKTSSGNSCGTCNGTASVTPVGGNPPFTYAWSDGQTTQTATGLCTGTYSVTVTETANPAGTVFWREDFTSGGAAWTLNINGPGINGNTANLWVINNNVSNCSQCPDSGSGGNYLHITCNTTDFICSFSGNAGSCSYGVGFVFTDASTDKYVTSPNISTIGKTNITLRFWYMSDGDGSNDYGLVRLSDDGGVTWTDLPKKYSGTFSCRQDTIAIPAAYENIPDFRIAFRWINNSDMNGSDPPFMIDDIELITSAVSAACQAADTFTISGGSAITINPSITNTLCNNDQDGAIKLNVSGGTQPYDIIWNNGETTSSISGLQPGIYSVTITDANECTLQDSIALTSVSVYSVETLTINAYCDGTPNGSVQAMIDSATTPPYNFLWSTGATTSAISGLAPGIYTVTVTDSLGCLRSDTAQVGRGLTIRETVTKPCPNLSNGSIITEIIGGVAPFTYQWNTGATSASLADISEGIYSLTVADQNDCRGADTIVVMTDTTPNSVCDTLIIYDVFTPNGDGKNEQWVIDGLYRFPDSEIQIFNRWGNMVFEERPYNNNWDGRSRKDELLPSATYYFILKLNDAKNTVYSGNVTIIR